VAKMVTRTRLGITLYINFMSGFQLDIDNEGSHSPDGGRVLVGFGSH